MSQSVEDIRADLAYMKDVVEDGGDSSMRVGGAILLAAGLIYGGVNFAMWGALMAHVWINNEIQLYIAGGATAAFLLALFLILRFMPKRAQSPGDRAISAAWAGVGGASFALATACIGIMVTQKHGFQWVLFPSIILALYGAAWMVSAVVTRAAWMKRLAGLAFISAGGLGFFMTSPHAALIYAILILVLAAAPGFYMLRQPARG